MTTDIKTKLTADITDFSSKMKLAERKAQTSSKNISSSFSDVGNVMSGLAVGVIGVAGAYQGLQAAAEASVGSIDNMTKQLSITTKERNIDTQQFIDNLRKASRGMIDDLTLIREANRGLLRGLSDSNVIDLMKVAQQRGEALGMSLQEAFGRLTSGVAKFERELLDELVTIDHLDVAFARYADTLGKTTDELSEAEKMQAVVNNIMDKTKVSTENATVAYQDLRNAAVAAQNLWNEIKADGFDWLDKMAGLVYKAADAWDSLIKKLEKYKSTGERRGGIIGPIDFTPYPTEDTTTDTDGTVEEDTETVVKKIEKKSHAQIKAETEFRKKLAQKREQWANEAALIDERSYDRKVAQLETERDNELALYGKTQADKDLIRRVYQDKINIQREKEAEYQQRQEELAARKAEREAEILEEKSARIDEFLEQQHQLTLSDQERELSELYEHYEAIWELMSINDERRLESVQLYQERKAAIEASYREKEKADFNSLGGALVGAQEIYDDAMSTSAEQRFGMISTFAQQAMQVGGEVGEKAFRLNQGIEIANAVVNTASGVMKAWAQLGVFGGPMAALIAATGAAQIATIAAQKPGGSSSSSSSISSGSAAAASVSTNFNELDGVTASNTQTADEKEGTYTINIMGDIMNEDYVDLMAEKISDAVQDRNVVLKASEARTVNN